MCSRQSESFVLYFTRAARQSLAVCLIALLLASSASSPIFAQRRAPVGGKSKAAATKKSRSKKPQKDAEVSGAMQGVLWQGEAGITETVAEIMERERRNPPKKLKFPREVRPELDEERDRKPNPESPAIASFPFNQPKAFGIEILNPQTVGTSFKGPRIGDTIGYIPPDTVGDVGPTQVLIYVNGRIRVFDKAGNVGGLDATGDAFFNSVRNGLSVGDPRVRYDRLSARWFVICFNFASTDNRILIAVSSGATITNSSSFTFFQFTHSAVAPAGDAGTFADYPTLGVDKFALYIGTNNFLGNNLASTSGFVVNKAALIGGTLTATVFRSLGTGSSSGVETPYGVQNDDPNATEGYFIGGDTLMLGRLVMRRVSNPGGAPSISANINITIPANAIPLPQTALGSTKPLDGLDNRLYAAQIFTNKITGAKSLWTANASAADATGATTGANDRNVSRWYEITNLTSAPTLNQSGTLFDNSAANPNGYWMPSVALSGQGHMAIGTSVAGATRRAEIAVAGRFRTDAPGTLQSPTTAQTTTSNYNIGTTSAVQRWGDYSQTVVDPNDDQTMWTFQEYCDATNSWAVRAVQLNAPPPATPASSAPAATSAGQPSVNVVITGTSVGGSEFFDPGADTGGPGFANHISATVSGGVTVNSVTFNNPTQITLNVSTVGAPVGFKNVTVTNPDGQSRTGNNLIEILAPTAAGADIAGRITGLKGQPLAGVSLSLIDATNTTTRITTTDGDGRYTFENVPTGADYFITPSKRNFTFRPATRAVSLVENLSGADFTATPSWWRNLRFDQDVSWIFSTNSN